MYTIHTTHINSKVCSIDIHHIHKERKERMGRGGEKPKGTKDTKSIVIPIMCIYGTTKKIPGALA